MVFQSISFQTLLLDFFKPQIDGFAAAAAVVCLCCSCCSAHFQHTLFREIGLIFIIESMNLVKILNAVLKVNLLSSALDFE